MTLPAEALPAAALWSGANLLLMLLLGLNVTRVRRKVRVGVGSGDSPELLRAIRAHGNNTEYVPGLVAAMMLMALLGYSSLAVGSVGAALLVARLLHAHGIKRLDAELPATRVVGNVVTWLLYLGCSVALVASGLAG